VEFFKNNEISIGYIQSGKGNPLFFIHGLGADHLMFETQIEYFSDRYHVVCPDLRGNGLSSKLTAPINTVLDRQCDDILQLMDSLSIDKAVFSGVSYGGVFCFHFALRYPEKVAALVITDSFSDAKIVGIKELGLMASIYISLPMLYFPKLLIPSINSQYKRWPLARKHMVRAFENMRSREVIIQRLAINHANHTPLLKTIKCPVLGMVGDNVRLMIKYMRRAMDHLENSEFIILENSFDPSNLCAKDRYNELVDQFLTRIGW